MNRAARAVAIGLLVLPSGACITPIAASYGAVFPTDSDERGSEVEYAVRLTPAASDLGFGFDIHYQKLDLPAGEERQELSPVLYGTNWYLRAFGPAYVMAGVDIGKDEATWGWEAGGGIELGKAAYDGIPFGSIFAEGGWTSIGLDEEVGGGKLSWPFARVGVSLLW